MPRPEKGAVTFLANINQLFNFYGHSYKIRSCHSIVSLRVFYVLRPQPLEALLRDLRG